jgi:DNA-binding NarL/FixJ family response regulator
MKPSLLLADDYPVVRYWFRTHFSERFDIVGEARTGDELLSMACATRPQLIIFDLIMPGLNSCLAAAKILAQCPEARLIVVTFRDDLPTVRRAFAHGVHGYVLKHAPEELATATTEVLAGRRYLAQELTIDLPLDDLALVHDAAYTPRQQELLQLMAQGLGNEAIAEKMGFSLSTIEHERCTLKRKYGLKSKSDFIKLAIQEGLISA